MLPAYSYAAPYNPQDRQRCRAANSSPIPILPPMQLWADMPLNLVIKRIIFFQFGDEDKCALLED
jgi:hypothetical protein